MSVSALRSPVPFQLSPLSSIHSLPGFRALACFTSAVDHALRHTTMGFVAPSVYSAALNSSNFSPSVCSLSWSSSSLVSPLPISSKPRHPSSSSPPCRKPIRATISEPPRVVGGGVTPTADKFKEYTGIDVADFIDMARQPGVRMVPIWQKVFSDQLTPVMAFRCLVPDTDLQTPSFLLESVPTSEQVGRYSLLGTRPVREVVAYEHDVTIIDYQRDPTYESASNGNGDESFTERKLKSNDPWKIVSDMSADFRPASPPEIPGGKEVFNGGWVGYGGYDTMRYAELKSLPFSSAPTDDRNFPDLHLGLYMDIVLFDNLKKMIYVIHWVDLEQYRPSPSANLTDDQLSKAHADAISHLERNVNVILRGDPLTPVIPGRVAINTQAAAGTTCKSNMTKGEFMHALDQIHHHLCVGNTFQTVFSQRFERDSPASPFDTYRALRIINPSPYMIYMQCRGCLLVASSPEILTRVVNGVLTNRPLAGTRRRGTSKEEDEALAKELLEDQKDRSEHMMLVDLGRNDVGKVVEFGTVNPEKVMEVERYSHVMHISSTITGKLRSDLTSWDALRSTLPAGTISGAPKIRAMQIIDSLEPTKRGPYGGGIGYVSFYDTMNMALALRTMVVPTEPNINVDGVPEWTYYLQAGAGIVFESDPEAEYRETVNKAMALNRAIDLAEDAFDSNEHLQPKQSVKDQQNS